MNKKQYNNVIEHTLKYEFSGQAEDSLEVARAVFNNMGISLPQGDIKHVYEVIKTDDYMGWRSCTMKEAQEAANNGTAAIGISENRIVVLAANDEEEPVEETTSLMTLSENTSAYAMEGLSYYIYDFGNAPRTNAEASASVRSNSIYCSNSYLTLAQMTCNAQYILDYLRERGWTKNAICGMLGNLQQESTINPGIWQSLDEYNYKRGFGLVQWTPATKYIDWANKRGLNYLDIDSQLQRILYEVEHPDLQWNPSSGYPLSFERFTQSKQSPSVLAGAFFYNYEQVFDSTLPQRREYAIYWYANLV